MPLNLNQIDIGLLPVLDALLQERSVTRAANRLGRSQPAVSHALRHLRSLFEDELLVRAGTEYALTAEAEAIAVPLHALLQQLRELLSAERTFDPSVAEREFSISTSDDLAASILRPVVQTISATAPGIRLNISETIASDAVAERRMDQGTITIYPADERPKAPGLHFELLMNETWCCAAWSGNSLIEDKLTLEKFTSLPHIIEFFTPVPEQAFMGKFLSSRGYSRKYIARTSHILLVPFMLQGTSALAVVPRRLADWLRQAADIRVFPLPFEAPEFGIEMCWSARYTNDPAHRWLRSVLKDAARRA